MLQRLRAHSLRVCIFAIQVILLALMVVFSVQPGAAQQVPTPTQPFIIPPTSTPKPCSAPLPLSVGQIVYPRPGVFLRNLPSLSGGQVDYFDRSYTLYVTGGPVCADGYNWWQVDGPFNPGWIAEGTPDFYFLFPGENPNAPIACPAPQNFDPGSRIEVTAGTRVRESASTQARVLTVLQRGQVVEVIGGVSCIGGTNWWPIRTPFDNTGVLIDGWIAEAQGNLVPEGFVPPPTPQPCAPSYRRLEPGLRAVVHYNDSKPKNLRAEPDLDAPILAELLDGVAADIITGPVCSDGLNWWQIQVIGSPAGLTGWMAEGGTAAGGYWLIPLYMHDELPH